MDRFKYPGDYAASMTLNIHVCHIPFADDNVLTPGGT
jgi:hypothetical protein